jgi:natural product precursor
MKKLKLKALSLGANQELSRQQLKNVLGGSGAGEACSTSACSLTIQNAETKVYTTFPGQCAGSVTPIGTVVGALVTCYCNAVGAPVPLESNSGVSRCGKGGIFPI